VTLHTHSTIYNGGDIRG